MDLMSEIASRNEMLTRDSTEYLITTILRMSEKLGLIKKFRLIKLQKREVENSPLISAALTERGSALRAVRLG